MKKLILHIGQSKTGTTALQNFLMNNREALSQRGIVYPDYFIKNMALKTPEHNSFAETLSCFPRYPNLKADEYFVQFQQQMNDQNGQTMILSAESFFGTPQIWRIPKGQDFFDAYKEKLHQLKKLTDQFETQIILYLRSPYAWMETVIPHIIRYEGLLGQKVYESDEQLYELLKPHVDYQKIIELWETVIQPKSFDVRQYRRENLFNQDTTQDFLNLTGIGPNGLLFKKKEKVAHSSLDHNLIVLKRDINQKKHSKTKERVIIECLDKTNAQLEKPVAYQLDQNLKQRIFEDSQHTEAFLKDSYGFEPTAPPSDAINTDNNTEKVQSLFKEALKSSYAKRRMIEIATKSFLRDHCIILYGALKTIRNTIKS